MTEGLFILTTIFVAYVVYVIIGDSKTKSASAPEKKTTSQKPKSQKPRAPKASTAKASAPKPSPAKSNTAKPAAKKASNSKPKAAAADVKELRNPETGETTSIASNYRFMKRWIKDALVSEGLLDTVYKNNAIDDAADAKIKTAIEKIKTLDKYKV